MAGMALKWQHTWEVVVLAAPHPACFAAVTGRLQRGPKMGRSAHQEWKGRQLAANYFGSLISLLWGHWRKASQRREASGLAKRQLGPEQSSRNGTIPVLVPCSCCPN